MLAQSIDRNSWRYVVGVAIAYFGLAAAAISFTRLTHDVALLWIANSLLLAALLTRPAVERPWHVIGCFAASMSATLLCSPYTSLSPLLALANVSEPLVALLLLSRFGAANGPFSSLRLLAIFTLIAGIAAPAISGVLPAIALWHHQGSAVLTLWANWVVGHGLGAVIGTPVALLAIGGAAYRDLGGAAASWRRALWIGLLLLGVTGVCFAQVGLPLLFLPILPLIIAAMAFRLAGAALGVFAIAIIGAAFTSMGYGPIQLINGERALHLQFFQLYLAVLFLTAMPFATMIAEKNRLARAMIESEARYRLIAEHASDAVLVIDRAGTLRFASPAVREIGGYEPEALVGRAIFDFIAEADRERMREQHARTLNEPERVHRAEFRGLTARGSARWFEATTRAVADEDGEAETVVTIVRDLSQRKAREADLERQATTDSMTGVLNRRAFQKRLANAQSGVLALLDLDHFKQVNDRFGHAAGDAALLTLADMMRSKLRHEDAIGRLGGEEFGVIFPGLTTEAALAACERLRTALEDTEIQTPQGSFRVTMSIGVAPLIAGSAPEAIFRQSDAALYRAKALGRNRVELAEA